MFSYKSLFLPASLKYFWFPFPPVSFKHLYSSPGSLGQAKKDLTEFPKHQALGRLLPPCLLRQGRHPLSPTTEGRACAHTACCCSCPVTGSHNTRASFLSQPYPGFQWASTLLLPMASWPQHGCRQAGEEESAGRPPARGHSQHCGKWELGQHCSCAHWPWMEPVYTQTSKALPCHWLWDSEGLLSCAVHLDNLRSQGSTVREDVSTWRHCPSGRLAFYPIFWSTTASSERTFPWKEAPMLVPDP